MTLLYTLLIHLLYALLLPVSLFSQKAALWVKGRKEWRSKLKQWEPVDFPRLWFHAASLGEFEQGLPVIEELKKEYPHCSILLTFFSPSGYEIRKNYSKADCVIYLPLDTSYNAREFIRLAKPNAAFFIKYEFWYFYLRELYREGIPTYLISARFRPGQIFFMPFAYWFRKKLSFFRHFFVQDQSSLDLLNKIGFNNVSVTGDTRFDRVIENSTKAKRIELAASFCSGYTSLIAGSTWPADEKLLARYIEESDVRMIIAPHETDQRHISKLSQLTGNKSVLYSGAVQNGLNGEQVLIIDNMGMLSSLYTYGKIAYIGGGFGKGIHNILEAAVFGMPVIFGPNYSKFREAIELIATGGAFAVGSFDELKTVMDKLTGSPQMLESASSRAKEYVLSNAGATAKILDILKSEIL